MNAMERLRRRLETLLDTRTQAGQIRQKRLAEYMGKSEAWLSNILAGKKGVRLVDLDALAEFFHVPPSELIREADNDLVEVTSAELGFLRKLRRASIETRAALYHIAGLDESGKPAGKTVKRKTRP
jgi:transcriptional regulator with XRE-family HTH domain